MQTLQRRLAPWLLLPRWVGLDAAGEAKRHRHQDSKAARRRPALRPGGQTLLFERSRAVGATWLAAVALFAVAAVVGGAQRAAAQESPPAAAAGAAAPTELPAAAVARFAELALSCVGREYPNKLAHVMSGDADALPPRQLTPAFFGCFDWHSAVHGHWLLVRLVRRYPQAPWAERARTALRASLTPAKLQAEAAYLNGPERASFERPYGLAWLLQLAAELGQWDSPEGRAFSQAIKPLQDVAVQRLRTWLPKLSRPVRSGEHSQTAFALGLFWDFASAQRPRDPALLAIIAERARSYYQDDVGCPIAYEPSGEDFLSPCLAEADVMRRVLAPAEFGRWLRQFLPDAALSSPALRPQVVTDPTDGKLAHLDGLNLSRAFMLAGIAAALPDGDSRLLPLRRLGAAHSEAGLRAVTGTHYAGTHWLGSFATYLVTGRGLTAAAVESHTKQAPK